MLIKVVMVEILILASILNEDGFLEFASIALHFDGECLRICFITFRIKETLNKISFYF